jgi:putative ABC transport system permease protein
MATLTAPLSSGLLPNDLAKVSVVGLRTRKLRAALSALGIAIGVAAIVAVLGLSASSQAGLLAEINQLGTNLLTVSNGQNFFGQTAELPTAAPAMIRRIASVTSPESWVGRASPRWPRPTASRASAASWRRRPAGTAA